ncbi:MAG: alpha/beta hydrolase [Thermoanaerobaculia bacterium]
MVDRANSRTVRTISRRAGMVFGILAALVAAVEITARITRFTHNRRVRNLGDHLHISVAGSGPPVIFLHGFRGSGRYWGPQVLTLAANHQIIIVDLLGFGESPWPADSSYDVAAHLDAIHRTVAPVVHGRRATIVGHSMGAILAAEYARRYRDDVSALIVLNAPMFRSENEGRSRIKEMSPMAAMFSVQRFWARASCDVVCAFRPLLFKFAPRLDPEVPPAVARDAVLHRWESFDRTLQNVVLRSNMEQTLRALVPLPITILHGTEDHITDRDRLETIAAETGAKLLFLRGDHNMYLRDPDTVRQPIAAALNR